MKGRDCGESIWWACRGRAVGGPKLKVSQEGVARVPGGGYDGMNRSKCVLRVWFEEVYQPSLVGL